MNKVKQTAYLPVNGETEFIAAEYENGEQNHTNLKLNI